VVVVVVGEVGGVGGGRDKARNICQGFLPDLLSTHCARLLFTRGKHFNH
jgi:hypothetical protein